MKNTKQQNKTEFIWPE